MSAHVPAYVHATVYLRQTDPDPAASVALWKALFNRWEEIFAFDDVSTSCGRSPTTSTAAPAPNSNSSDAASFSPPTPPSPGAILLRFLLCCGSVLPGTLPSGLPTFAEQQQQHQQQSASNHSVGRGSGGGGMSSSATAGRQGAPSMMSSSSNGYNDSIFRTDDAIAALAYAEWWQWVMRKQLVVGASSSSSSFSASTSSAEDVTKAKVRASSARGKSKMHSSSSSFTAKFLFATAIKVGCLFQFVSVSGLQGIARCPHFIDAHVVARAQAALLATVAQLPSSCPLPPPFLLAHLPGLRGATGEAFMDVLPSTSEASAAASQQQQQQEVDFFSFTVQRCVPTMNSEKSNRGSSSSSATADMMAVGEVGLELKFLDDDDDDADDEDNHRNAIITDSSSTPSAARQRGSGGGGRSSDTSTGKRIRTRPPCDDNAGNMNDEGADETLLLSSSSNNTLHHINTKTTLWTPRWQYGCARFISLPSRAVSSFGLGGAMSAAVNREPPAGLLRVPSYEEPFGIRYVLLVAQRLLSVSRNNTKKSSNNVRGNTSNNNLMMADDDDDDHENDDDRNATSPLSLIRLASRLAFWAATAAASFPMELPAARSSFRYRGAAAGGAVADSGLQSLNELVCIPCMAASLALYCSLSLASHKRKLGGRSGYDRSHHQQQRQDRGGGGGDDDDQQSAVEALLSVSLAYAACSYAATSSSATQAGREQGALTLRQVILSVACQWINCFPPEELRAQVPRHVIACLPTELQLVIDHRLHSGGGGRDAVVTTTGKDGVSANEKPKHAITVGRGIMSFASSRLVVVNDAKTGAMNFAAPKTAVQLKQEEELEEQSARKKREQQQQEEEEGHSSTSTAAAAAAVSASGGGGGVSSRDANRTRNRLIEEMPLLTDDESQSRGAAAAATGSSYVVPTPSSYGTSASSTAGEGARSNENQRSRGGAAANRSNKNRKPPTTAGGVSSSTMMMMTQPAEMPATGASGGSAPPSFERPSFRPIVRPPGCSVEEKEEATKVELLRLWAQLEAAAFQSL